MILTSKEETQIKTKVPKLSTLPRTFKKMIWVSLSIYSFQWLQSALQCKGTLFISVARETKTQQSKVKISYNFLPWNDNSKWSNSILRGIIKLSFLTMFISVEPFSLKCNQIVGLYYDGILEVCICVECSNSYKYNFVIK